ncbi:MAG: hypothetical protein HOJ72_04560, partial [Flavobacterium sp.]|nr:hypothetical protein [Flavobacterium sp.]
WNPDLGEIKTISNRAYFTIELEGEEPILLYDNFGNGIDELVSIEIPENSIIKNDIGKLYITITQNDLFGDLTFFN